MEKNFKVIIENRKKLNEQVDRVYLKSIEDINKKIKEFDLNNSFKKDFLKNCASDMAGEFVRRVFNTSDYYLTVDQLEKRMFSFTYENEYDPLNTEYLRKDIYNLENSKATQEIIKEQLGKAEKLFIKEDKKYIDQKNIEKGKNNYRETLKEKGEYKDEVGTSSGRIEVDHIQPLATITIYNNYIKDDKINDLKEFYNDKDNFAMLGKSANASKGDVRVINPKGEDITYDASAEEYAEAIFNRWEKDNGGKKIQNLKNEGILNQNGKVKSNVKRKVIDDLRRSKNMESIAFLKYADYKKIGMDAILDTGSVIGKMIAGQVVYYFIPPLIYEFKELILKENNTESLIEKLSSSGERVIKYFISKIPDILKSLGENSLKKFTKTFFDIIINILKETVKKLVKIVRQVIIMSVDAVKILLDKNKTWEEKMDAIFYLFSILISSIVSEILIAFIEKALAGTQKWLVLILEIFITTVSTNLVMLLLKELDLFGVNEGFRTEKIKEIFKDEREKADIEINALLESTNAENNQIFEELETELKNLENFISQANIYKESVTDLIDKNLSIFGIESNTENEWEKFLKKS